MRVLLLLLPLVLLAARMQVEWSWFQQFQLETVLLHRWLLQLAGGAAALIPIGLAHRWNRSIDSSPQTGSAARLQGWRYSLVLLLAIALQLVGLGVINLLVLQAMDDVIPLADGWQLGIHQPQLPVLLLISLVAVLQPRLRRWLPLFTSAALVLIAARAWRVWALAWSIQPAGLQEPFLQADVSFALGRFSALQLLIALLSSGALFCLGYGLQTLLTRPPALSDWGCAVPSARNRRLLLSMAAMVLVLLAGQCWLSRHALLWQQHGIVAGAGWLQRAVTEPFRELLTLELLLLALALLLPSSLVLRRRLLIVLAATLILEFSLTPFSRWLILRPQELSLQTPYLEEAIRSTRHAFQLDRITRGSYKPEPSLSQADLEQGASTLRNLRLWDSAPLLETNRQLQQLRVYYRFPQASVDRYPLSLRGGTPQQVILSARELDQSALPRRSQTWLNRHFVFTHGYGFTVSPVNTRGEDGLPEYFISDLGTDTRIQGNRELGIERDDVERAIPVENAALYFGMLRSPYAVAPTRVNEFDYPEGDLNVYTHYRGSGGLPIGHWLQRAAAATYLLEPRLLTAGSIDPTSKLLIRREVRQRVHAIAPFLDLRGDPYLISIPDPVDPAIGSEQHQYWVVEGFTHSSTYPYSAAVSSNDSDRYLRNSVKAVVDAYNGSVQLYISEPDDPLIQGWARVFPQLFQTLEQMPSSIRDHLRVPEELFDVQVKQLQRYHVEDPRVFYSGDDVWQVPLEVYDGEQITVRPYHITAQVLDRSSSEFLLLQPLTPLARPNLTAWLAARNDGDNYGKLVQIDFPKDTPILGPEQVQALINQDPEISKVFGLWDRGGSQVVQGNLLVVPVGQCLLYVEPVYLRASKGGLPSLTRIVVSDGRSIAMADTLPDAIDRLMQKTLPPVATGS